MVCNMENNCFTMSTIRNIVCVLLFFITTYDCHPHHVRSSDTDMHYVRVCNQTSPVSLSIVNEVLVHKKLKGTNGEDEEYRFKCFLHCLFTKYGWMDEDGGFMLTEMRRVLEETLDEPPVLHHLLYECTALESPDRCHRALQFTKCFWDQLDQHQQHEDHYNTYNFEKPTDELADWLRR